MAKKFKESYREIILEDTIDILKQNEYEFI